MRDHQLGWVTVDGDVTRAETRGVKHLLIPKGAPAMHGPVHPTNFSRIVALDLGKFNSVACVHEVATGHQAFTTIATTPQAVHDLLAEHVGSDASSRDVLVVFETCDCAGWVYDVAVALGLSVAVANPSNEAWRWNRVKRKTDRDDALKLVRLTLVGQLPTAHVPDPQQRQRRRLIQHRRSVVQRRTMSKNAVRSIFSQQGLTLVRGNKQWTRAGIEQLAAEARPLNDGAVDELWRGRLQVELDLLESLDTQLRVIDRKLDALGEADERVTRLQTVPGVGPRLAEAVVAHLDDPHRFRNARQVSAYAGLVPKQIESGTMKRVGKITHQGPSLLRGLLVEVAWMAYRYNAWAKSVVEHVSRGMKQRRKIAVVALARRLLVRLWAMLRDNTPWRDPTTPRLNQNEDGRSAAGGRGFSPPEDTAPNVALSSVEVVEVTMG
jgi:transposase